MKNVVLLLAMGLLTVSAAAQATITVNTTSDNTAMNDGLCTLREAIGNANQNSDTTGGDCAAGSNSGADTLEFTIAGAGVHTISPGSALPVITDPVVIDGETQGAADCGSTIASRVLTVVLDGSSGAGSGLELGAGSDGSTIRGLVIHQWPVHGVQIVDSDNNVVACNLIGTDAAGTADLGNSQHGVAIVGGANGNTVGGTVSGAGNVISGNDQSGVLIFASVNNTVLGNYVGTDVTGGVDLGNSQHGVAIESTGGGHTIGGTAPGARNVISGNDLSGVVIEVATGNTVAGNYIGTDATGSVDLGNTEYGVFIHSGTTNNTIGGTASGAGNVISGNDVHGMRISGSGTTGNTVAGNFIGTDAGGTIALGNGINGVRIRGGASGNTIGGTTVEARNVISGNPQNGVRIDGGATTGNTVAGNFIGTDASGTAALGNGINGVLIRGGASSNTIGGTATGARNVISGNVSIGVLIEGSSTTGNLVAGNYIGTDATGTADLGNSGSGVAIRSGASSNTIGGTAPGARNVISGNEDDGVFIDGSATTGNLVQGNYIGTDATGTADLGTDATGTAGLLIGVGASNNTIGGTASGARNVISGNYHGVVISGSGTTGNTVQGNYIGTDATGTAGLGNSSMGVRIYLSASNNTIGGTASGARNVISGNFHGVVIEHLSTTGNTVQGNYIGTDATGAVDLGNTQYGVFIGGPGSPSGTSNNTIGGTASGAANTIAFNGQDGVVLFPSAGTGNAIRRNSLFSNGQLGIDLGYDGSTPNDPGDADAGPNNFQNFPILTSAVIDPGGDLIVTYLVDTDEANATYPLAVGFFEADADEEEGQVFLGTNNYTTADHSGCGTAPCTKTVNLGGGAGLGVSPGDRLVTTATDDEGNTSEFSASAVVSPVTRFVATTSNDTGNDCTDALNPCATLGHAVAQANAGDTIDLAAGTYNEPGLVIDTTLHIQGQGVVVQ